MRGKCGPIVVALGNLPPRVGAKEIRGLVRDAVRKAGSGNLRLTRIGCDCSILRVTDLETRRVELKALVEIRPAILALRIIEHLDGFELRGHKLAAGRYRQGTQLADHVPVGPGGHDGPPSPTSPIKPRQSHIRIDLVSSGHGLLDGLVRIAQRPWWYWWTKSPRPSAP
jgi:hypothetical protein